MKKLFTSLAVLAFMAIPAQGAFAWSYDGMNSLNPFTGFRNCGCKKVKVQKCKKPKLTKCEKLHGVKIKKVQMQGTACGCATPVQEYVKIVPSQRTCDTCQRAF